MGAHGPYRCLVLGCDDIFCSWHLPFPHILHRRPRVSWCRWWNSRAFRIRVSPPVSGGQVCFGCFSPCKSVASRWPLGESHAKLSNPGTQPRLLPQLYRCYIIYGMNYWAIAFPSAMYLVSWGTCSSFLQAKCGTHGRLLRYSHGCRIHVDVDAAIR